MPIIKLSEDNCHHCMRCVRACPTNAMTYINNEPVIDEEECILCGKCYAICPHSAKRVSSDIEIIQNWIDNKEKVVLSVAPSFVRVFPSFKHLKSSLIKKGFYAVDETSKGAKKVSEQYLALMNEGKMDNIISTCCPAIVDYVEKYFPECVKYLAPIVSPMIAHAKELKEEYGDVKVVFLTPCIAKKKEILKKEVAGYVDATISMEEMMYLLDEDFSGDIPDYNDEEKMVSRIYPSGGGVLKTLPNSEKYKMIHIEGIKNAKSILETLSRGELHNYFIEMSSCDNSCINGPLLVHLNDSEFKAIDIMENEVKNLEPIKDGIADEKLVTKYQENPIVPQEHSEEEIKDVLNKMGKTSKALELNCGACGYDTCRLKAIAVLENKADINLCLPKALKDAKSYSNLIILNTPNGIIVLDENLKIEEINPAAKVMFEVENINVIGLPIEMLLNDNGLMRKIKQVHNAQFYRCAYEKYGLIIEHAIIKIHESKKIILILMDLTIETKREKTLSEIRKQTIEVTDRVIDEQMRTVQEIASLLGETTAKAKVALNKLKRELEDDRDM